MPRGRVGPVGSTSFQSMLEWLDDHIDHEAKVPRRDSLPTLDRMHELVSVLGDPHQVAPAIHITGTNGKGSTAAIASSLLAAKGLKVGTYTSPNLERVNERLVCNGESIEDEEFARILGTLAGIETLLTDRPTRFELLTAAAFLWFAEQAVDVMVVEVGLGGTWDCTNVIDGDVAVVTNISLDHTDVLGPTLEGIAMDKIGIVKPKSSVVIGETSASLVSLMSDRARTRGANSLWTIGNEFGFTENRLALGGRLIDLYVGENHYDEILLPLHGPHQASNAACALASVERFFESTLDLSVVEEGFRETRIPGRLEILGRHPLTLIDGAHNIAGMVALKNSLLEEFQVDGKKIAVIGMLNGRDPYAMLGELFMAGIREVIACSPNSVRAMSAELVADAASANGMKSLVGSSVAEAIDIARSRIGKDGLLVVSGSLYVVSEARSVLGSLMDGRSSITPITHFP